MATPVAKKDGTAQFLFTVSPDASLMNGFRINGDGSLAPVAGSPFVTGMPMHSAVSVHQTLVVAGKNTISAFAVDKDTGAIQLTDTVKMGSISKLVAGHTDDVVVAKTSAGPTAFRLSEGKLKALPETMAESELASAKGPPPSAVLDASGRFMYVTDATKAELDAFQIENGKPRALSPAAYPLIHGSAAVALVKPEQ